MRDARSVHERNPELGKAITEFVMSEIALKLPPGLLQRSRESGPAGELFKDLIDIMLEVGRKRNEATPYAVSPEDVLQELRDGVNEMVILFLERHPEWDRSKVEDAQ